MALMARIEEPPRRTAVVPRPPKLPLAPVSRVRTYLGAGVTTVAVALLGIVVWQRSSLHSARHDTLVPAHEYHTTAGQRLALQLYDGTQVIVAPNSTLRIPGEYGSARRDVYLDGAAYFDVAASADRPFTAHAGSRTVHVLGTSFAVRGYAADTVVTVVVGTGKVALSQAGVLTAGDVGSISATGQASVRHESDVSDRLAWTSGRLVFHNARLADVLDQLSRWYGVRIRTSAPTAGEQIVTVTFDGESQTEAVSTLATLLHVTPIMGAQGITLVPSSERAPRELRDARDAREQPSQRAGRRAAP